MLLRNHFRLTPGCFPRLPQATGNAELVGLQKDRNDGRAFGAKSRPPLLTASRRFEREGGNLGVAGTAGGGRGGASGGFWKTMRLASRL